MSKFLHWDVAGKLTSLFSGSSHQSLQSDNASIAPLSVALTDAGPDCSYNRGESVSGGSVRLGGLRRRSLVFFILACAFGMVSFVLYFALLPSTIGDPKRQSVTAFSPGTQAFLILHPLSTMFFSLAHYLLLLHLLQSSMGVDFHKLDLMQKFAEVLPPTPHLSMRLTLTCTRSENFNSSSL